MTLLYVLDDEEEEDGKGSIEKLLDEAEATGVVQLDQFRCV